MEVLPGIIKSGSWWQAFQIDYKCYSTGNEASYIVLNDISLAHEYIHINQIYRYNEMVFGENIAYPTLWL